ncbi:sugar kinase [Herbiconiux sp. CPCC 205763]|uniref:Sugar kinase n=1 Tax=Herbiconiux aconitum TaxID=2970913 RepID=A0ABT2GMW3_9MICO|nr:sugar kinase [Herbiconiux aconitum]MCS5716927.1 sugar kinase [Herbiconiux aconitum]
MVGIGEAMVLLEPGAGRTLETATAYSVHVAGAELNACAAVAALGGRPALVTRLGDDPFAARVHETARRLGVSLDADTDSARPTGIFFKEPVSSDARRVHYYRAGSAASRLGPEALERALAHHPRAVLVSGLTAALGEQPAELFRALAGHPEFSTRTWLVIDANLRPALGRWEESLAAIRDALPVTRLLIVGADEGEALFGTSDPGEIAHAAMSTGCREVVIKDGKRGCHWIDPEGHPRHLGSVATTVVDTVGAGDAFTGGYLWARLDGADPEAAALIGSRLAALVISAVGDTTGLPGPEKAAEIMRTAEHTTGLIERIRPLTFGERAR